MRSFQEAEYEGRSVVVIRNGDKLMLKPPADEQHVGVTLHIEDLKAIVDLFLTLPAKCERQ